MSICLSELFRLSWVVIAELTSGGSAGRIKVIIKSLSMFPGGGAREPVSP